jgi:hypothetical protein
MTGPWGKEKRMDNQVPDQTGPLIGMRVIDWTM